MNELKVGDVWINKTTGKEVTILYIGECKVFCKIANNNESDYERIFFMSHHTLKKPEPKLTKLVAWFQGGAFIRIGTYSPERRYGWEQKEVILKDDKLWVED